MEPNWASIRRLFQQYLDYNPGRIGGGLTYNSIPKWMADREQAYMRFSPPFKQDNLKNMEAVCHAYELWVLAKNNKSWTNLHRRGFEALDQPVKLCKLLSLIQQETVPIEKRVQSGLVGKNKVNGIGKGTLTGLLHTMYPDKYGVWNGSTVEAFEKLTITIPLMQSLKKGQTYTRINVELNKMASRLDTDLTYVDGFMWYVATRRKETEYISTNL